MKLIVCIALFFGGSLFAQSTSRVKTLDFEPVDAQRQREVPVKCYFTEDGESRPVILFSHGLGGSRNNNPYLGNHWAAQGYIVVFVQHAGSDEAVWKSAAPRDRFEKLKGAANLRSTLDRFRDIPFVLDQLERWNSEEGHPLNGRFDLEKIGMCGHSFGAVTTQALMGQKFPANRSFAEPRFDAFLPMSPSIPRKMDAAQAFGEIKAPVLCMTGTKDGSPIDPTATPESRTEVYQEMPEGDKYQLLLKDAEHHAFGDGGRPGQTAQLPHHHPAILNISTKFWDAYLKDDPAAKVWLQSSGVRKAAKLADGDIWEWK
ncbi:MAG: hypothetical protein P1U89_07425 [Verrucomicrobiales bacterium]|nr:hypothetical protein [Verrucomicrobiales bacterium]